MVRIEQTSADAIYRGLTMLAMNDQISFNSRAEIMNEVYANMVKSEPEKFDLNNLQFYFSDAYDSQFAADLMKYIKSGRLKAYWKDRSADTLKGEGVPLATFDEMHKYPGRPFLGKAYSNPKATKAFLDKFKDIWSKEDRNIKYEPVLPMGAVVHPSESKLLTHEGMKKILEGSGYTVTKTDEQAEKVNDIAHRVNAVYGIVEYLKPLIERIDSDRYIIKSGLGLKGVKPGETKQANVNKELDNYPLTKRQLDQVTEHVKKNLNATNTTVHFTDGKMTEEQANEFLSKIKNDLAKSMREERLKGKVW